MNVYVLLADIILVIHFGIVLFLVGGLIVIWTGHFLHWTWIRNSTFRIIHLGLMGFILVETLFGIFCPLTVWENQLRKIAGDGNGYGHSFIQYWLQKVIYFDLQQGFFVGLYLCFFLSLLLTFWKVPPRFLQKWKKSKKGPDQPTSRL